MTSSDLSALRSVATVGALQPEMACDAGDQLERSKAVMMRSSLRLTSASDNAAAVVVDAVQVAEARDEVAKHQRPRGHEPQQGCTLSLCSQKLHASHLRREGRLAISPCACQ